MGVLILWLSPVLESWVFNPLFGIRDRATWTSWMWCWSISSPRNMFRSRMCQLWLTAMTTLWALRWRRCYTLALIARRWCCRSRRSRSASGKGRLRWGILLFFIRLKVINISHCFIEEFCVIEYRILSFSQPFTKRVIFLEYIIQIDWLVVSVVSSLDSLPVTSCCNGQALFVIGYLSLRDYSEFGHVCVFVICLCVFIVYLLSWFWLIIGHYFFFFFGSITIA